MDEILYHSYDSLSVTNDNNSEIEAKDIGRSATSMDTMTNALLPTTNEHFVTVSVKITDPYSIGIHFRILIHGTEGEREENVCGDS